MIYFLDTSALLRTLKNGGPSREVTSSAIVQKLWKYFNVLRDDLSACGHAQAGRPEPFGYAQDSLHSKDHRRLPRKQVTHPVVAKDVTIIPEFLNDLSGHTALIDRYGFSAYVFRAEDG